MSRYCFGFAAAVVLALAVSVGAQTPPQTPPQTPATPPAAAAQPAATVTVEGCLVREADVPGRKPNVAERAGVLEDYILTSVKMVKGTAPKQAAAQPKAGEAPTGTSGMQPVMYEVKGIDDEKLKSLVGRRVQIEGTFEDLSETTKPATPEHLADIKGTVIRQVSGECPAKQ